MDINHNGLWILTIIVMVIILATPPNVGASPTKEEWVALNRSAARSTVTRVNDAHLAILEARGLQSQIGPARENLNKLLTWGATREKFPKNTCNLCLDGWIESVDAFGFDTAGD